MRAMLILALSPPWPGSAGSPAGWDEPAVLHVDARRGSDKAPGSRTRPLRTISAALEKIPDPATGSVVIELSPGEHDTTGGVAMPGGCLQLFRRMPPGVSVEIRGSSEDGQSTVLTWQDERRMVLATEGHWRLVNLRLGHSQESQRRGVEVVGPADVVLQDVSMRLRGQSGEAMLATGGGHVRLRGAILVNEHLHDEAPDDTFSGLLATDYGVIEFDEGGGRLELGNGSLSCRYYGQIRLGCESARVTSWTTSNNLGVNSSGRIDVRGTPVTLRAHDPRNTPIGLEHDGHVLAEDAVITIHVERVGGEVKGPVEAFSGAVISLPDRVVRGD